MRMVALAQSTTHWWKISPKLHFLTLFLARMMNITTMLARQPSPARTRRMVPDIFLCPASSAGQVSPLPLELVVLSLSFLARWTMRELQEGRRLGRERRRRGRVENLNIREDGVIWRI